MDTSPLTRRPSAADIPLDRLASNQNVSEADKIGVVSQKFEAILLREFLSEAQKPLLDTKGSKNDTMHQIYRDMVTDNLSDAMSKSGSFGLASTFQSQLLTRAAQTAPLPEADDLTPE